MYHYCSFVFWSDWANLHNIGAGKWVAKIERSNADGSDRRAIITKDIHWPNGLALDYQNGVLYWCDAYFDRIERADFDGTNRKVDNMLKFQISRLNRFVPICFQTIITQSYLTHPYGIAFFKGFLFWTEFRKGKIMRINVNETRLLGKEATKMYEDPSPLFEIHVYDNDGQKGNVSYIDIFYICEKNFSDTNLCSGKLNGGCEQFCFFVNSSVKCDCSDGFSISPSNSKMCIGINHFWLLTNIRL